MLSERLQSIQGFFAFSTIVGLAFLIGGGIHSAASNSSPSPECAEKAPGWIAMLGKEDLLDMKERTKDGVFRFSDCEALEDKIREIRKVRTASAIDSTLDAALKEGK